MNKGQLIDNFLELIYLITLEGVDVFISRRSLKHFVESRFEEMSGSHKEVVILDKLYFIINNIENVLLKKDSYEEKNNRFYFTKHFWHMDRPSIRIVFEYKNGHYEIVTMHYKKTENTKR